MISLMDVICIHPQKQEKSQWFETCNCCLKINLILSFLKKKRIVFWFHSYNERKEYIHIYHAFYKNISIWK